MKLTAWDVFKLVFAASAGYEVVHILSMTVVRQINEKAVEDLVARKQYRQRMKEAEARGETVNTAGYVFMRPKRKEQ